MNISIDGSDPPFALTRRYALASLIGVLITAVVLAFLYRDASYRAIVKFGEQNNVTLATLALSALLPELNEHLHSGTPMTPDGSSGATPAEVLSLIQMSLEGTPVVRIKIYDADGRVAWSTQASEVGRNARDNPRLLGSIGGKIQSKLLYRDAFDVFEPGHKDEDLIETYVPIWGASTDRPIGVFELYTDVRPLVSAFVQSELLVFAGIGVTMIILYGLLLFVVRRSDRVIGAQRQTIVERNQMLETLSWRVLAIEESERRRVAWELHEEVAQTLAAVKVRLEALAQATKRRHSGPSSTKEIVPLVQGAIRDVRALAMDVRPPALDEFGLVTTARLLCRDAEQIGDRVDITAEISVCEQEVPEQLKDVIFRVMQQTLKRLVKTPGISDIRLALTRDEVLRLVVTFTEAADSGASADASGERPISDFWERAVLSGATVNETALDGGHVRYQATWPV